MSSYKTAAFAAARHALFPVLRKTTLSFVDSSFQQQQPPVGGCLSCKNGGGLRMMSPLTAFACAALQNFSSDASGYFKSVRKPATLLAGSSLTALFTLSRLVTSLSKQRERDRFYIKGYHVLFLASFCLSVSTILFSTAADVTILHGGFDPMAQTVYALLMREFEFEFATSRWSFLVSLITFMLGVEFRVLLEFDLLSDDRLDIGYAASFFLLALLAHFLSYINSTLYSYPNLFGMTFSLSKLVIRRAMKGRYPMQIVSLGFAVLAIVSAAKILIFGNNANTKNDNNDDDQREDDKA